MATPATAFGLRFEWRLVAGTVAGDRQLPDVISPDDGLSARRSIEQSARLDPEAPYAHMPTRGAAISRATTRSMRARERAGCALRLADANSVPLPGANQFFDALVNWVEYSTAPDLEVLQSVNASVTMPVCPSPKKPVPASLAAAGGAGSAAQARTRRWSCRPGQA